MIKQIDTLLVILHAVGDQQSTRNSLMSQAKMRHSNAFRHFKPSPLTLAITLLVSGNAWAQTAAPAQNEVTLATVQVTAEAAVEPPSEQSRSYAVKRSTAATKLDIPLKETPQAVSVVTRARIEDFQLNSVNDLLDTVTGINVERVETDRTYYSARGFDITNFQIDGVGVPFIYGNQYGDIDISPYDRVEVIKGANGLISATGNPSATVNFVRKRPTTDFQASAGLSVGSWNKKRLEADVSGPLNEAGSVRGRFVAAGEKGDSYLDRLSYDKTSLYGIVEADLTDNTTAAISVSRQQKKTDGGMWGALPLYDSNGNQTDYDASTSTAADWTKWNNTDTQLFAELTHQFNEDWQAKATYTHREQESHDKLFYVYGTPDATTGLGLYSYPSLFDDKNIQNTVDASLNGKYTLFGRKHQLAVGVQFARSNLDSISHYGQGIGTALPDLASWDGSYAEPSFDASVSGAQFTDTRKSLYAATHYSLTDDVKLLLGAAATKLDTTGSSYGVSSVRSDSKITPYAGITYSFTPNATAYASYAEIFDPQSKLNRSLQRLDPVTGKSYEVGLKNEWLDKKLNTSISAFKIYQDNLAESDGYVGTTAVYQGIDTTSRGIELEASGEITPNLQASVGYTVLSIKDKDGNNARTYVPRRLIQASTTWRVPGMEQLKLGASVIWKSDMSTRENNVVIRQDAYALLNLMARYDINKHLSTSLNVNNVTNEKYLNSLYWTQAYYGAPRNFTVSLNWKY